MIVDNSVNNIIKVADKVLTISKSEDISTEHIRYEKLLETHKTLLKNSYYFDFDKTDNQINELKEEVIELIDKLSRGLTDKKIRDSIKFKDIMNYMTEVLRDKVRDKSNVQEDLNHLIIVQNYQKKMLNSIYEVESDDILILKDLLKKHVSEELEEWKIT